MTEPQRRGRGRPPLVEGERPIRRTVVLPADVDEAAAKAKGSEPWASYLRRLVEQDIARGGRRGAGDLGANLQRLRHGAGLSQAALAARAGVDPSLIKRLEARKRRHASTRSLNALAGVLDCTPGDLLGDPGQGGRESK